jgi:hypothetical protein
MSGAAKRLRGGIFAAAVAGALGFGAAQVLAAPAPAAAGRAAACSWERCDAICVSRGHAYGDCSTGACRCFD